MSEQIYKYRYPWTVKLCMYGGLLSASMFAVTMFVQIAFGFPIWRMRDTGKPLPLGLAIAFFIFAVYMFGYAVQLLARGSREPITIREKEVEHRGPFGKVTIHQRSEIVVERVSPTSFTFRSPAGRVKVFEGIQAFKLLPGLITKAQQDVP